MDEARGVATNAFASETLIFLRKINVLRTTDREPRIENNMNEVRGFSTNAFAQEMSIFLREINVSRTTH